MRPENILLEQESKAASIQIYRALKNHPKAAQEVAEALGEPFSLQSAHTAVLVMVQALAQTRGKGRPTHIRALKLWERTLDAQSRFLPIVPLALRLLKALPPQDGETGAPGDDPSLGAIEGPRRNGKNPPEAGPSEKAAGGVPHPAGVRRANGPPGNPRRAGLVRPQDGHEIPHGRLLLRRRGSPHSSLPAGEGAAPAIRRLAQRGSCRRPGGLHNRGGRVARQRRPRRRRAGRTGAEAGPARRRRGPSRFSTDPSAAERRPPSPRDGRNAAPSGWAAWTSWIPPRSGNRTSGPSAGETPPESS